MLSKPKHGWTVFSLNDEEYGHLGYLNDIAFEWLEQAIHGLETKKPFVVTGFMEPGRCMVLVSYWNCYVGCELEDNAPSRTEFNEFYPVYMNMLEFCKQLYYDIALNKAEWANFQEYKEEDLGERLAELEKLLERLKGLIEENEDFDQRYYF